MITRDKENILAVMGLALFSILFWVLMCIFPANAQTPADDFYNTFRSRPDGPAIGEVRGMWFSVLCPKCNAKCWQHSSGGYIYDDLGQTTHQCANEVPIGDVEPLIIFAVITWLIIGIIVMFNNLYKRDNGRFRSSKTQKETLAKNSGSV